MSYVRNLRKQRKYRKKTCGNTANHRKEKIALHCPIKNVIIKEPRRFITQEVIDFQELEIYDENGNKILRKADFRAYVLTGESTVVWKSGLTRYTTRDDTFIVNSSQGGGFKDTWVLSR